MVIHRIDAFSSTWYPSTSPPDRYQRWRAFLRCRRRLKRDNMTYFALTCALCAFLVLLPLYSGQAIAGRYSQAENLQERKVRSEQEDFDGSSVRHNQEVAVDQHHGTKVEINCTEGSMHSFPIDPLTLDQRRHGAVIIHVLVMAYMFAALGIVCEEYFMPALEVICDVLNLSEDVAGATFMAMGGSAPELFSSLIAVFITHDDIGVGTIVGSAVFNILCVIGLCGLLAGQVIYLTCWPLIRDSTCYIISIIALVLVVNDGDVTWKDSVSLLVLYLAYCILMYFNPRIEPLVGRITPGCCQAKAKDTHEDPKTVQPNRNGHSHGMDRMELTGLLDDSDVDSDDHIPTRHQMNGHVTTSLCDRTGVNNNTDVADKAVQVDLRNGKQGNDGDDDDDKENEPGSPFELPQKGLSRFVHLLAFPIIFAFFISIPDCRRKRWKSYYVVTFISALLWIGFLTYILVWMVTVIGDTIGIRDTVMGLTLLAAGASTPDTMLSIIAARGGYGDMAISHSIGSNLFDILIGLGLPWFIQTVIVDHRSSVTVYSGAISYISMLLLLTVFIAVVLINICRYRLGKMLGVLFIIFFVIFIVVSIMFELNFIIPGLTLPPCD